ncbi:MAG: ferritin family protein [Paludibacteraceae bacterium]|nr:ferritin family protein [Paludibacteraceae bacterium]
MKDLVFNSIEEILAFAIKEEVEANIYYENQAKKTTDLELKMVWEQLAHDELRHKAVLTLLLEKIESGGSIETYSAKDIADYIPVKFSQGTYSDTEKIIMNAAQKENEAFYLYSYLSGKVTEVLHQRILLSLAEEELKHKENLLKELDLY